MIHEAVGDRLFHYNGPFRLQRSQYCADLVPGKFSGGQIVPDRLRQEIVRYCLRCAQLLGKAHERLWYFEVRARDMDPLLVFSQQFSRYPFISEEGYRFPGPCKDHHLVRSQEVEGHLRQIRDTAYIRQACTPVHVCRKGLCQQVAVRFHLDTGSSHLPFAFKST